MNGKQYVASLSYGKDSMAMLHVIKDVLDLPLDRIVTVDLWATDTIPAELPPMVNFKEKADRIIKERYGIEVEHFCALNKDGSKKTFKGQFYKKRGGTSNYAGKIHGWPMLAGRSWCNGELKRDAFNIMKKATKKLEQYIGIAFDESERVKRHQGQYNMPLVDAEWTEAMCYEWCEQNGLLSPIYEEFTRGGCWFCVNQNLGNLRYLRNNYPKYYQMMLEWDKDTLSQDCIRRFTANGRSLHDIEKRFRWEEEGYKPTGKQFRWADIENPQMNIEQYLNSLEEDE